MAIKDWKKSKNQLAWNKNHLELSIGKSILAYLGDWVVQVENQRINKWLVTKYFKTKPQALKFAKTYMRKH